MRRSPAPFGTDHGRRACRPARPARCSSGGPDRGSGRRTVPVTAVLVVVNVAVYLLWHILGRSHAGLERMAASFLLSTRSFALGRPWALLLAEFSHVDGMHLLFNMVGLWTFG